jgi:hypothetical protein
MMILPRAALVMLVVITVACGRDDEPRSAALPPAQVESTPLAVAPDTVLGLHQECVNRAEGYAVAYPEGWHTNAPNGPAPCSVFHPAPFRIPVDSEMPVDLAVTIGFEAVSYAELTGEMLGRREISREATRVDGREALSMVSESTGEGLHEPGLRAYQFFVDLGDTTMIATTYDAGAEPAFERRRRILDAMMASFDFRAPG